MSDPNAPEPAPAKSPLLSNGAYDKLKFLAVILLPALGTLYFGLAEIWGLPKAQEVVGTIVVVDTFLGVLLQLANSQYQSSDARFDGSLTITPNPDELTTDMNVKLDPQAVATKKEIQVKIRRE